MLLYYYELAGHMLIIILLFVEIFQNVSHPQHEIVPNCCEFPSKAGMMQQ